jgi:nucleoside-diphosphate-sugar epimerase
VLTGQRSELGEVLAREYAAIRTSGRGRTLVNLSLQGPNTLLSDGRAWWPNAPEHILSVTRRALAEAQRTRAGFMVHASYAFLAAAEDGGTTGNWLRGVVEAAREAEQLVLGSGRRACVVRLGYLYGPESRDLRAYRRAFALRRPYWAGPRQNLQHHLHTTDAARALLLAASERPALPLVYATDGTPASFADFMDHFAHLVGRSRPAHLPGIARRLVWPVVREPHQELCDLAAEPHVMPHLPGFRPRYANYRVGLAQVVQTWDSTR